MPGERERLVLALGGVLLVGLLPGTAAQATGAPADPAAEPRAGTGDCAPLRIHGDGIDEPLLGLPGDPERGRRVAMAREGGDCTLCHRLPLPGRRFHGTLGPVLDGVGDRLTAAQLRLRIAAGRALIPASVMPEYCRVGDRHRVAEAYRGEPVLSARQIEDLVAWLSSLKGRPGEADEHETPGADPA